jgi:hypothetical protein
MKVNFSKWCLAMIILLMSLPAFSWWDKGHQLVAKIAYDRLTPNAKAEVDLMTRELAMQYTEIKSVTDVAVWPDNIRKQKIETFTRWHYIDMPFSDDGSVIKNAIDTDNALWAVKQIVPIIQNPKANLIERARFFAFLVHIVGDLHQPLHSVSRVSKEHPDGDRGGNLFFVMDNNAAKLQTLHGLWDGGFGVYDNEHASSIDELEKLITGKFPEAFFGDKVKNNDPAMWVSESGIIAREFVYNTPEKKVPTLAYQEKGKEISEQRVALAGYRLATMLNQYFSNNTN